MSTKQTVLYTLMIFFLILTLIAGSMWFHAAVELDAKQKQYAALADQKIEADLLLNGTSRNPEAGLKFQVDDPQRGIDKQLADQIKLNNDLRTSSDPNSPGVKERREQYEAQEPEMKKAWTDTGVPAWKQFYDDWARQNTDIAGALDKLKKQKAESEEKIKTANDELIAENAAEEVERKKVGQESAARTEIAKAVRLEHEETQQKVNEVSREYSKERSVTRQGLIMQADPLRKTATINLGANNGVRKGMDFNIYSGEHRQIKLKGLLRVVETEAFSSKCVLLEFRRDLRVDPITGYVPKNPSEMYSPFAAGGPEETDALELVRPKTKADRIEALRLDKIAKEQGLEAAQAARESAGGNGRSSPPNELSLGMNPISAGDWIFSLNFVPVVTNSEFRQITRDELLSMKDVNVGSLTFYITDTVRVYRKEYLRRLAERNGCKVSNAMTADVNVVVAGSGFTRSDLLEEKLASSKGKEDVKDDVKSQRSTLAALQDAKKYAADIIAEDEMEAFFDRRQRKLELLRGKAIQPGRQIFFIAGKTLDRSQEQLARYIEDHGGIMARSIDDKVDYVVVGEKPEDVFMENVKKRGLKIIREAELPELFGSK